MELMTQEKKSAMERHAQSVLVMLVVAQLTWVGMTVWNSSKAIVRLQEQVLALSNQINASANLPDRVSRLEVRVSQLEQDDRANRKE